MADTLGDRHICPDIFPRLQHWSVNVSEELTSNVCKRPLVGVLQVPGLHAVLRGRPLDDQGGWGEIWQAALGLDGAQVGGCQCIKLCKVQVPNNAHLDGVTPLSAQHSRAQHGHKSPTMLTCRWVPLSQHSTAQHGTARHGTARLADISTIGLIHPCSNAKDFRHASLAGKVWSARANEKPAWRYESQKPSVHVAIGACPRSFATLQKSLVGCNLDWHHCHTSCDILKSPSLPSDEAGWLPAEGQAVQAAANMCGVQANNLLAVACCASRVARPWQNMTQDGNQLRSKAGVHIMP